MTGMGSSALATAATSAAMGSSAPAYASMISGIWRSKVDSAGRTTTSWASPAVSESDLSSFANMPAGSFSGYGGLNA